MKAGFVVCVTNVVPKFGSMFVVQRPGHQCSGSRFWRDPLADKLGNENARLLVSVSLYWQISLHDDRWT